MVVSDVAVQDLAQKKMVEELPEDSDTRLIGLRI